MNDTEIINKLEDLLEAEQERNVRLFHALHDSEQHIGHMRNKLEWVRHMLLTSQAALRKGRTQVVEERVDESLSIINKLLAGHETTLS